MHFSGVILLQCCSGRRSSYSEHSNLQLLSVDEGNWMQHSRVATDAKYPGRPENHTCRDDSKSKGKMKRRRRKSHNQKGFELPKVLLLQIHPPLRRNPNIDWFLVKAAAALTYPAVVSQKLSPFLHLLQNLLPFVLNLRHRLSHSFPLITWTNQRVGG